MGYTAPPTNLRAPRHVPASMKAPQFLPSELFCPGAPGPTLSTLHPLWVLLTQIQQHGLHGLVLLHHQVAVYAQPMHNGQHLLRKV